MTDSREAPAAPVVIVGAGAAGMFAAAVLAEAAPALDILVFEKNTAPLEKVRLSGGGRCNLSHVCDDIRRFCEHYPRGGAALIGPCHRFGPDETRRWFAAHGVPLMAEADGRLFPLRGGAKAVIQALLQTIRQGRVRIRTDCTVLAATPTTTGFTLTLADGSRAACRQLLVAAGGGIWLDGLDHTLEPWTPSLFTFRTDDRDFTELAGITVPSVTLSLRGQRRYQAAGDLLITHQGVSGPAVLQLSALAARALAASDFCQRLRIDWQPAQTPEQMLQTLTAMRAAKPGKRVVGEPACALPGRVWRLLALRAGIPETRRWSDCATPTLRRLAAALKATELNLTGRNPQRGEFVTAGGIRLAEVDFNTMQSRRHPGLYLAGEVLDIDGLTGGYNLQAAWTTGFLAAQAIHRVRRSMSNIQHGIS